MAHYKDTQLPAEVDPEILWDEHSALIGEDIDDLSYWSGKDVMKKEDFLKAIATYATKAYQVQQEKDKVLGYLRRVMNIMSWLEQPNSDNADLLNEIKTFLDGQK